MKFCFALSLVFISFTIDKKCFSQTAGIKPSRTISFTTDEGTDMDVDVSPDGSTLLFDLLGDLYSVPAHGGKATQLTRGISLNSKAVWSPDGQRIAYVSDYSGAFHLNIRDKRGNFHIVLGANDEQLRNDNNTLPVWTTDGNAVAIEGNIYSLCCGNITSHGSIHAPVKISSDGRFIYYLDSADLFRYDRSLNVRTRVSTGLKDFESAALSPDGHWWAYVSTDSNSIKSLKLLDLAHQTERVLVPSLIFKYCLYTFAFSTHFSFSPDSKGIFIGYGGKIHRINVSDGAGQIIPFMAQVKADLGPLNYNRFHVSNDSIKVKYTRSASSSPDGKRLVFNALNQIYIMDLPGGKPHLLSPQPVNQFQPAWSPDGKWVAYVSWCDTVGGFLWRVSTTGGKPTALSRNPGEYQQPAWTPDGRFIAVVKGSAELGNAYSQNYGELDLIPVNGGMARVIDKSVPLSNKIAFSAGGERIIYEPARIRGNKLDTMLVSRKLDGSDLQVLSVGHSEVGISDEHPLYFIDPGDIKERSISPDGRFLAYSLGEDLYLAPINDLVMPAMLCDARQRLAGIRFAIGIDLQWEQGGKVLSWSYGNRFFRINPDKVVAAATENEVSEVQDSIFISGRLKPDQTVSLGVTVPYPHAHGRFALRHVRILTMRGSQVIENGTILMSNGRFVAVGQSDLVRIPEGTKVLDLPGTTVMPGMIDVHLHMSNPPDIWPQQSWMFLTNLAYGVTTARDPSTNVDAFGYSELVAAGKMIGPRLYPSGLRVEIGVLNEIPRLSNMDDASAIVQKRVALGGTFIKQYGLPTRLLRQWLSTASRKAGMNMTNEGSFLPMIDLGMIKDGSSGIEHNPSWGDVYKDIISFYAQSGTYLTPTLQVHKDMGRTLLEYSNYLYWHGANEKLKRFMPDDPLREITEAPPIDTADPCLFYAAKIDAAIHKQGGLVALGSHGNNEGVGVHNELWALQLGGLSNMEALQAATIIGAEAIGIQQDVGSIEVGKIADLIILNKNPLDDIHNSREIRYVIKDGTLYDGDTLDEIWPVERKCPEWRLKGE
jgi:imidazolonepropionase-like amidohydrolase/Tol biopolymer transport system component